MPKMSGLKRGGRAALVACSVLCLGAPAGALAGPAPFLLAPLTKLRLSVVQFMPSVGDYKRWDALGGDLEVSPDGTVMVPALGAVPAGGMGADALAASIATRLQAKLGLVDRPDATIQIVEYPPIFLAGNVAAPGQYAFRPGMTVLQALAIGGGEYRAADHGNPTDTIKLQGDLQGVAVDIVRSTARIARLEAQLSGAKDIVFPASLDPADPAVADIIKQERTIFAAQQNELVRQTSALNDLGTLYRAEIDALDQKSHSIDDEVAQAQQQLDGVKQLVAKGVVVLSRQSDLERALAGLRSDRLDNVIATMSARQGLSESTRNLAKLEDDRQSEVSVQLQAEQANLNHLQLTQTTTMRLLRQATDFASADAATALAMKSGLVYTIVRQQDGQTVDIAASESTPLLPGDLLKVDIDVSGLAQGPHLGGPRAADLASAGGQASP